MMDALTQLTSWAQEQPLHICIDLASAPDGLRQVTSNTQPPGAINLFQNAGTTDASAVAPWLLPVEPSVRDKWLSRSYRLATEVPAVTWLYSDLTTPELAQRLARRLDVTLGDGTQLMLRFFDPRILDELNGCLNKDLAAQYFSIGTRWAYLNRDLSLQHITSNSPTTDDPLRTPIMLGNTEEQALVLASEAGQTLKETLQRWPDDLFTRPAQARFDLSKQACTEGDALGLTSLADKVCLLMLAAGEADGYFVSPQWMTHKQALQSRQTTLLQLLEATVQSS